MAVRSATRASRTKKSKTTKSTRTATRSVRVKSAPELLDTLNDGLRKIVYGSHTYRLSESTRATIVSYGPWLMAALLLVILPQLMVLAKTGSFIGMSGFFEVILFNQSSWVLLLMIFANCMLLAGGLSHVFATSMRGWSRMFVAVLLNGYYILSQLAQQITQPAAPLLSLLIILVIMFVLYDIQDYYKS